MAKQILTDLDLVSTARVTNMGAPVGLDDAVRLRDLNSAVEGLAWKDSARVASVANINLAAPGANVDGVALSVNDRVLVKDQAAPTENGIYIFNGAATPMTRAPDASVGAELVNATLTIDEGTTNAATTWRQTAVNITLGVTSIAFAAFGASSPPASETTAGIAELATQAEVDTGTDDARIVTPLKLANWAGRLRKYATNVGDASNTTYTITHNLNSRDVVVEVFRNSGGYDSVQCDVERSSVNAVVLTFLTAPALNAYRVVVSG